MYWREIATTTGETANTRSKDALLVMMMMMMMVKARVMVMIVKARVMMIRKTLEV